MNRGYSLIELLVVIVFFAFIFWIILFAIEKIFLINLPIALIIIGIFFGFVTFLNYMNHKHQNEKDK